MGYRFFAKIVAFSVRRVELVLRIVWRAGEIGGLGFMRLEPQFVIVQLVNIDFINY